MDYVMVSLKGMNKFFKKNEESIDVLIYFLSNKIPLILDTYVKIRGQTGNHGLRKSHRVVYRRFFSEAVLANLEGLNFKNFLDTIQRGFLPFKVDLRRLLAYLGFC